MWGLACMTKKKKENSHFSSLSARDNSRSPAQSFSVLSLIVQNQRDDCLGKLRSTKPTFVCLYGKSVMGLLPKGDWEEEKRKDFTQAEKVKNFLVLQQEMRRFRKLSVRL